MNTASSNPAAGTGPSDLPPDRGHLLTEQVSAGPAIDQLSIADAVALMNAEDAAVPAAVASAAPQIAAAIERVVACWQAGGRLIYLGAGTSGRLGVLDASECPPTFQSDPRMVVGVIAGGDVALRRSVENVEDHAHEGAAAVATLEVGPSDCVLGIAAGATTPYVHGALAEARRRGAATVFLACVPRQQVHSDADLVIAVPTGPEVVTGSTRLKAGTATKLVLNMITTIGMTRLGKVHRGLMVDLNARVNRKLVDRATRVIGRLTGLDRAAAHALLHAADGQVKVALVMHGRRIDREAAAALLARHGGRVQEALEKL